MLKVCQGLSTLYFFSLIGFDILLFLLQKGTILTILNFILVGVSEHSADVSNIFFMHKRLVDDQ